MPAPTNPLFKIEKIFSAPFKPSTMAFLGKDDFLILDRDEGKVFRIMNGTMLRQPVLDVNVATVGYRGMLGIAVSQDGNKTLRVFLYYTEAHKDREDEDKVNPVEPIGNRVYGYDFVNGRLINPKLLLNLPAMPGPRHMGGIIALGPDNNLYVSVGDLDGTFRGRKYDTMAQNYLNSSILDGRSGILRITQDGQPVGDGILGSTIPLNLYYAYGIRNSFGFDWDPLTDNLWDTENGPHYGDEINIVEPGFNSGWVKVQGVWEPNFEQMGKIVHDPEKLVSFNGKGNYSEPEFTWIPTVAPTALVFFNSGNYGAEYTNTLFVGDANTGSIYNFKLNSYRNELQLDGELKDKIANTVNENKKISFAGGFGRITDMEVGPDGNLYILASENGLSVHKISLN
ncbi:MAG: PQQ-dependent sugar dehydrogenase [Nitrososphaeraceae archaeon]